MTENDKEILVYRILSGQTHFTYDSERYTLYAASPDIKYESCLIYDQVINEEKFDSWLREEHATNTMIALELWNFQTDNILKGLDKKLDDLKVELFTNFMLPSKTKNIRSNIKNTKSQISKIHLTKQNFISNTLEGYASSIKNEYIICNTLYRKNKKIFDFNNKELSESFSLFNVLLQEIDKLVISTEQYKLLARSQLWRSYWNCNKYNDLFDKPSTLLTDEQRALLNISRMYDNIYEHPECPDDLVIEDDDALDGWMILQKRKNEKTKKQSQFDNNNPKLKNAGEIFMMAEEKEDIASISQMNNSESAAAAKEKLTYIKNNQDKLVQDGELPDVRRDVQMAIQQLKSANRKK